MSGVPEREATGPAVSVILPVFNAGRTLLPAVRSILLQTMRDFELIVLDDGSTDGAMRDIEALDDRRLRLIGDGRNLGLAARLNQGIDLAGGRFIARMDQDDLSFPDRFARQRAFLESRPEIDLVASRAVVFRDALEGPLGMLPGPNSHERIVARPWRGVPMPHPSWFGRVEWFRRHRYWQPEYVRAEDQEILLRAMPMSRYEVLDEVLLAYRVTGFDRAKLLRGRRALLRVQWRHFREWMRWDWLALALATFTLKAAYDGAHAVLRTGDEAFFSRFGGTVPDAVASRFKVLANCCGALDDSSGCTDKS